MFVIDRNMGIHITAGDTAIMDVRFFNKSWHIRREPHNNVYRYKQWPLIPLIELNSEGNPQFVFNSEGYPVYNVNSEGIPYWVDPVYPLPRDSEGNLIIDPSKIIPKEIHGVYRRPWPKWPEVEEIILPKDRVSLKVMELGTNNVVLEKEADVCWIEFTKEDTENLEPKFYIFQITYEPEYYEDPFVRDPQDLERNTSITGMFEVLAKI